MKGTAALLTFLMFVIVAKAQDDESWEERDDKIQFETGLFITFEDFRKNNPIPERDIVTELNPNESNFYYNLLKDAVQIKSKDSAFKVKQEKIWGYFDGKGLYLNRKLFPSGLLEGKDVSDHLWAQVIQIGKICLIYYNKNFKPELSLLSVGHQATRRNKPALFLMDSRNGEFYQANVKALESLIQDDTELASEFKRYRGDDEEKLYIFLKRYNDRHKLELIKS